MGVRRSVVEIDQFAALVADLAVFHNK